MATLTQDQPKTVRAIKDLNKTVKDLVEVINSLNENIYNICNYIKEEMEKEEAVLGNKETETPASPSQA